MRITIHGKQDFLDTEKPDINIELPDFPDYKITKVEFRIPTTKGDPNYHRIPTTCSFEIDYTLNKVWLDLDTVEDMFKNFYQASDFKIYKQKWTTTYIENVNSRLDDEKKIMYVGCK